MITEGKYYIRETN